MIEVAARGRWLIAASIVLSFNFGIVRASDFGTSGLITTPTARQMQDGYLAATVSTNPVVNIFNITYQATPWLETTFRYSVFNPYGRPKSSDGLRDRSYEAKARLVKEPIFPGASDRYPRHLGHGGLGRRVPCGYKTYRASRNVRGLGLGQVCREG